MEKQGNIEDLRYSMCEIEGSHKRSERGGVSSQDLPTRVSMCSDTKDTGTTTKFFTPDAPSSIRVSSVYGLREKSDDFIR